MALSKAYEEVVDFIAAGSNPSSVVAFRAFGRHARPNGEWLS